MSKSTLLATTAIAVGVAVAFSPEMAHASDPFSWLDPDGTATTQDGPFDLLVVGIPALIAALFGVQIFKTGAALGKWALSKIGS